MKACSFALRLTMRPRQASTRSTGETLRDLSLAANALTGSWARSALIHVFLSSRVAGLAPGCLAADVGGRRLSDWRAEQLHSATGWRLGGCGRDRWLRWCCG